MCVARVPWKGFCGTLGVEDRPGNYLHGRLLFLHRWVGRCTSAAEAAAASH